MVARDAFLFVLSFIYIASKLSKFSELIAIYLFTIYYHFLVDL